MTQPLETVHIEILPDFDGFARALRRDLRVEVARLEIEMRRVGRDIEKTFEQVGTRAGRALGRNIREGADIAREALDKVGDEATEMGRDITRAAHNGRTSLLSLVRNNLFESISTGFQSIAQGAGEAFSALSGSGGLLKFAAIGIGIAALVGPVIALSAALVDLIGLVGLIPAGFTVLLAAVIPVITAFQNFGDAVSAIASGDIEKINEALAKLSPSAAAVAREIGGLLPVLRQMQRLTQEALFAPLKGDFTLLARTLLPALTDGFRRVAGAFGGVLSRILEFFALPAQIGFINRLFATTARIIDALGPSFIRFLDGFLAAADKTLPVFERLSKIALDAFGNFGDFLAEAARTGELDAFIQDALDTMRELKDLTVAVSGVFKTLFAATDDEGRNFIGTLTDLTIRLNEFLKTPEGQRAINGLIAAVGLFGASLGILLNTLIGLEHALFVVVLGFAAFGHAVTEAWEATKRFFTDLADGSQRAASSIVAAFASIPDRLSAFAGFFATAGRKLISSFVGGFRTAGNFIGDVAGDIVGHIRGGLNVFIRRINDGIATLDNLLPFNLSRIPLLAGGGLAFGPSMIAEHGQKELAVPLNDPRAQKAIQQAIGLDRAGPSVTIAAGAIQINFDGVIPTTSEARRVGENVLQGITDLLARQGIRTQARAI